MERVRWFQLHSGERVLSNQAGGVVRRGELHQNAENLLAPAKSLFLRFCFESVGER